MVRDLAGILDDLRASPAAVRRAGLPRAAAGGGLTRITVLREQPVQSVELFERPD
jgi:hypothetical protein